MSTSQPLFISYRRKDAAVVDARIETGLAHCGALLAWFSADYPRARACQWEITAALIAARADAAPLHRVLIAKPRLRALSESQHTQGRACDVEIPGKSTLELAQWAIADPSRQRRL